MSKAQPYTPLYLLVIEVLSVLACAVKPRPLRRTLFALIVCLTVYVLFWTTAEDLVGVYPQGLWIATNVWIVSQFTLLSAEPQQEFRKIGDRRAKDGHGSVGVGVLLPVDEMSLFERLRWSFDLLTSPRGLSFSHGTPVAPTTKYKCISTHLKYLLLSLAIYDFAQILFELNPAFSQYNDGGGREEEAAMTVSFHSQPWWIRPTVLGHTCASMGAIGAAYCIWNILLVLTGLAAPMAWPFTFGPLHEGWTLQRAWGTVWHQNMRRFVLAHAAALHAYFGLPARATHPVLYRYFQLYTAFGITAFIHFCGDYMVLQTLRGSAGALLFFVAQAFAITFESAVMGLGRRLGMRGKGWRGVGYVWVVAWFSVSLPWWIEPHVRIGLVEAGRHESLLKRAVVWAIGRVG